MTCPQCNNVPISLLAYSLIGWKYIHCRSCGARLVLKSFGKRFWPFLGAGVFLAIVEWFLIEKFSQSIPVNLAAIVFALTLLAIVVVSLAIGWKDASVELR